MPRTTVRVLRWRLGGMLMDVGLDWQEVPIIRGQSKDALENPSGDGPGAKSIDELMEVALAKNPNIRTRTVGEFADALGHALAADLRAGPGRASR